MLRKDQIEVKAHAIIEAFLRGEQSEDSGWELKAAYPEPNEKTARQLGGLANAARGTPVFWLIGIDEKGKRITGAKRDEAADWFARVASQFDDRLAPSLAINLDIHHSTGTLVVLAFETDRAPYLVKAGADRFDVPWREDQGTRSAKRHELLRILSANAAVPHLDVIEAVVECQPYKDQQQIWSAEVSAFVAAKSADGVLTIPLHRCSMQFIETSGATQATELKISVLSTSSPSIRCTNDQLSIHGAGRFTVRSGAQMPFRSTFPPVARIRFNLPIVEADFQPLIIDEEIPQERSGSRAGVMWRLKRY